LRFRRNLQILALFGVLSVAWTWPLATQLTSRVAFDPGDPFLNTWILWWNAQAVPFTERWWSPPIFYPMRGALTLSEHLAGIGFFTSPLIRFGATPALAYNVAFLLSFALSGFFTYQLVKRLTGSTAAAISGGLAFAFAPFRAGQLSHLQVLTAQWLPLQLLALHAYLDSGLTRWLLVFGVAWILQGLSNGYYLLFAPVLVLIWVAWFVVSHKRWSQGRGIAVAIVLASLPLIPVLSAYRQVHAALGLVRTRTEMIELSAGLQSFLNPPATLAFWPPRNIPATEDFLFPGITMVAVTLLALGSAAFTISRRDRQPLRSDFVFYVLATLLMGALTLGPARPDAGVTGWLKPYQWLVQLPGFSGLRVPARFGMLMALCLAVAGGLGLSMILPADRVRRVLLTAIVAAGITLDGFMKPIGVSIPPGQVALPEVPGAIVLELPPDDATVNVGSMFRSISHRRPLINGYSGYVPPHYAILGQSLRRGDPSGIVELARRGTLLIIIAERHDPDGSFRRLVESIPGVEPRGVSSGGTTYVLPAQQRNRTPVGGTTYAFTSTRLPRSHVVLDLSTARVVRGFEFPLRSHYADLGRRVAIETSLDGVEWNTAWEDWTGGVALAGALEDQALVPMRMTLPDVTARYLRIHPAEDWLVEQLRVSGP
jgi:hypothetical protein